MCAICSFGCTMIQNIAQQPDERDRSVKKLYANIERSLDRVAGKNVLREDVTQQRQCQNDQHAHLLARIGYNLLDSFAKTITGIA